MLIVRLPLLNAVTISALSLQLLRPNLPAGSNSIAALTLPNDLQVAANASSQFNSSGTIPQQWDGTIELPLIELNLSPPFPSSDGSSRLQNNTHISMYNVSAGPKPDPVPRPAPDLPPLPHGWNVVCNPRLGTGISPRSCLEAWALLPPIERIVSFGPRNAENTYDVGLPKRYQSCTLRSPSPGALPPPPLPSPLLPEVSWAR